MSIDPKGLILDDGYTNSFKTAIDCLTKEADAMDAENRIGRASMLRSIVEELQAAQARRAATSPADTRTDIEGGTWSDGGKVYDPPAGDLVERLEVAADGIENVSLDRRSIRRGYENVLREAAQALWHQSTGVAEKVDSFVMKCLIDPRTEGEVLFSQVGSDVFASLDGYAVIPIEKYHSLMGAQGYAPEDHWPCGHCGAQEPTKEGHDPCIANLPGVKHACCGHGSGSGYAMFEDGRLLRGNFDHVLSLTAALSAQERG